VRGTIESFDEQMGEGVIVAASGKRYAFAKSVLHDLQTIVPQIPVLFLEEGGRVAEATPAPGWNAEEHEERDHEELDYKNQPNLIEYFILCLARAFIFRGRAPPEEYWSFWGGYIGLVVIVVVVCTLVQVSFEAGALIGVSIFAILFFPSLAVTWRRFHDAGFGGAGALLLGVPLVGWIFVAIVALAPSQRHTNQYGPHPMAVRNPEDV
jgi:uncharacterized membrane protein YhaH (DUF805 family)